jgi:hypothetical protein
VKLGIMQPYFLPYLGYWQLIKAVDKYVVYDNVTYIKGGWINRNNLMVSGERKMFTVSLKGASSFKLINEVEIGDSFHKLLGLVQANYAKAPYFNDVKKLLEDMVSFEPRVLSEFITNSMKIIMEYLCIDTEILISSNLLLHTEMKGKDKVIKICEHLGADTYYNAIGGQELYSKAEFAEHGIELRFLKTNLRPYAQQKCDFVPGLSVLDLLMFNSPKSVNDMLDDYELV